MAAWNSQTIPIPTNLPGLQLVNVFAFDTLGHNGSVQSGFLVEHTLPALSVDWTPSGTTLHGFVDILATATDASGIKHVEFYIDGNLEFTDTTAPYTWIWNTHLYSNGNHSLLVIATDTYGNTKQVSTVLIIDNAGPIIVLNSPTNESILEGPLNVMILATLSDLTAIHSAILSYSTGGPWTNVTMVISAGYYEGTTSTVSPGSFLYVKIYANDTLGNSALFEMYQYEIVDTIGPVIESPNLSPAVPTPFDPVVISVDITDYSGVSTAILSYQIDAGSWTNLTMNLGTNYWITLSAQPEDTVVTYQILANDTNDQWSISPAFQYTVVSFDVLPPTVHDCYWIPQAPNETDSVTVYVNVTDPSGLGQMPTLQFYDGTFWHDYDMHFNGQYYYVTIPAYPYGTRIFLQIKAWDGQGNMGITPLGEYTVHSSDHEGPTIADITYTPIEPFANESIHVTATITDTYQITLVILSYNDGDVWRNLTMHADTLSQYSMTIPAIGSATTVYLQIYALDSVGNWAETTPLSITVQSIPEPPPPPPPSLIEYLPIIGITALIVSIPYIGVIVFLMRRRPK